MVWAMEFAHLIPDMSKAIEVDPKDLNITHHFGGGVYIKETRFNAGEMGGQHAHSFEHLSYLVCGKVKLLVDGVSIYMEGPQALTIKAEKVHEVHCLTDVTWLCIHATECTDPEQVDTALIGETDAEYQTSGDGS